jgi:hypothetical protein
VAGNTSIPAASCGPYQVAQDAGDAPPQRKHHTEVALVVLHVTQQAEPQQRDAARVHLERQYALSSRESVFVCRG